MDGITLLWRRREADPYALANEGRRCQGGSLTGTCFQEWHFLPLRPENFPKKPATRSSEPSAFTGRRGAPLCHHRHLETRN